MTRIAIIGAGLAGLTLARRLGDHAAVTVYEKSRGPGGRMATRSAPPYTFDHGAQFFVAKSDAFRDEAAHWRQLGIIESWNVRFAEFERDRIVSSRDWDDSYPHFVGVPGMNAIGKHLADGIDVRLNTQVAPAKRSGNKWLLCTDHGDELGTFDWVISTAPAAQTATLLPGLNIAAAGDEPRMLGCYALMLGFRSAPPLDWQAALVREADISWVSVNSSKPGRDAPFSLLVHSTNAYAESAIDAAADSVTTHLLQQLRAVTGLEGQAADHCGLHRWRYANIARQSGAPAVFDAEQGLGACGDWLISGRIEAAFNSAASLAASALQHLK